MVSYFKEALGSKGQVFAGNSSPLSPAFYYADNTVITPLIYDSAYIPFLLDFCRKNKIQAVIPLFDIDLPVLARNKEYFLQNGIRLVVSDEDAIAICNDKWKCYKFCQENQILTPATYISLQSAKKALQQGTVHYPLYIKPRWGMGSLAVYQADNELELDILFQKTRKKITNSYLKYEASPDIENCVLIQEKLNGQEYGIDIINNMDGETLQIVVKKKISMRSGETDCAMVVEQEEVKQLGKKLGKVSGHIANLDVDCFLTDKGVYLLEMNARFGGGYPFTHMAGVNLPAAIVKWLTGQPLEDELTVKTFGGMYHKDITIIDISKYSTGYS